MPQMRGLPADGVRGVPLLQGHEEVWRPRAHEAELHHAAVHRCEYTGVGGALASLLPVCWSALLCPPYGMRGSGDALFSYPWLYWGSLRLLFVIWWSVSLPCLKWLSSLKFLLLKRSGQFVLTVTLLPTFMVQFFLPVLSS